MTTEVNSSTWTISDKTYEEQRKHRLFDAVADYLDDDQVSAKHFYNDFIDVLNELGQHHAKQLNKFSELLRIINSDAHRTGDGDAVQSEVEHPQSGEGGWYEGR